MSQPPQQLPAPNAARLAITSLCRVLHHHGVTCLEPETLRQAKFDGPVVAPLWRALHDLVLLLLCGCPAQPQPAAGSMAAAASGSAAVVGLALERQWERVAGELAAGAAGEDFPSEAAALVLHQLADWGAPPALLQQITPPGSGGGPVPEGHAAPPAGAACEWRPLQVRSRLLLLALGWLVAAGGLFERRIAELEPGPEARVLLPPYPPAATDCRNRLSASLASRQLAASPVHRPLTPYELQLCAQPSSMQRHLSALEGATLALLEQQELAAHGALFFDWLGSVLEQEEEESLAKGHGAGGGGRRQGTRAGKGAAAPLSSLEALPPADSPSAVRLGEHLQAQLAAAMQAAEPELSAARRRLAAAGGGGGAAAGGRHQGGSGASPSPGATIQHFLSLAERAVSEPLPCNEADDGGAAHGRSGGGTGGSGRPKLPLLVQAADGAAGHAGTWRLPDDIAAAVASVQDAETRRRSAADEESARFRLLRYAALARYDYSHAAAAAAGPLGGAAAVAGVLAADDTQRLLAAVLATARPLARTRAAHKAALLAALQNLPDGYVVAGL
ncbi:hypothetical protein GPECTOR_6g759 [Gonium pectorale]|uniref:Tubulin epsilon and delta complex protein 1 domain-containing protein n=1 Tax=Gonium pectorale TaxID=33097 RepID=A0A150GVH8_GONPE|nr:hypothetical protein GPECTOR_6g759 [Gonium pectorale]|eukprot:KXZ53841.1 hypothetical protein GPECTOR_6g759 [Gonium pectorale]